MVFAQGEAVAVVFDAGSLSRHLPANSGPASENCSGLRLLDPGVRLSDRSDLKVRTYDWLCVLARRNREIIVTLGPDHAQAVGPRKTDRCSSVVLRSRQRLRLRILATSIAT